MDKNDTYEKFEELKEKFGQFYQHRKKLAALENYSEAVKFQHKKYLGLIKACLRDGFLDAEEADFLEHMLNKYQVSYLQWAHRTKWLKNEVRARKEAVKAEERPEPTQMVFGFEPKQDEAVKYPVALVAMKQKAYFWTRAG